MNKQLTIAVDAMGGDDSPLKIIKGIELFHNSNDDVFFKIFGNQNLINKYIYKTKINKNSFEIIHTEEKIGERTTGIGNWKDRPVPGMFDGDPKGTGVDTTSIGDAQKERNKLLEHMFNKRAYPGEEGKPDSIEDLLRTNPAINPYPKDDWTKEIEDKVKNKPDRIVKNIFRIIFY